MMLLVWGAWAHFCAAFDFAAPLWSRDSSIDIGIPLWPAKLLVPVAFSCFACGCAADLGLWPRLRLGLRSPSPCR